MRDVHIIFLIFYLASNLSQQFDGVFTIPEGRSSIAGCTIFWPSGTLTVKFCNIAATNKNIIFRANVSPAQSRFPAPNGKEMSNFRSNFPLRLIKRLGLKVFASLNRFSSSCATCSMVNTKPPWHQHKNNFFFVWLYILDFIPWANHNRLLLCHAERHVERHSVQVCPVACFPSVQLQYMANCKYFMYVKYNQSLRFSLKNTLFCRLRLVGDLCQHSHRFLADIFALFQDPISIVGTNMLKWLLLPILLGTWNQWPYVPIDRLQI